MKYELDSSPADRSFYCKNFHISLKFLRNGCVHGTLMHFPKTLRFNKEFHGIYSNNSKSVKLAFFIEWSDPNLPSAVLTAFTGEIFNYKNKFRYLVLRWLQTNESSTMIGSYVIKDAEVLIDSSNKNSYKELKSIRHS